MNNSPEPVTEKPGYEFLERHYWTGVTSFEVLFADMTEGESMKTRIEEATSYLDILDQRPGAAYDNQPVLDYAYALDRDGTSLRQAKEELAKAYSFL